MKTQKKYSNPKSLYNRQLLRNISTHILPKAWYQKSEIWLSIILAVLAGIQAYHIANQPQEVKDFNKLLEKLNIQTKKLTLQQAAIEKQLELSRRQDSIRAENNRAAYHGSYNRFTASVLTLGKTMNLRSEVISFGKDGYMLYIDRIKPIFERELDNPFLLNDRATLKKWMAAYWRICSYTDKREFSDQYDNEYGGAALTPLTKVTNKVTDDIGICWDEINAAYIASVQYIKNSKTFK